MNVHPLELDLFLCAFILGNFAWSLWGKGEGCVRSWNWPRKGWLKVVVLNSGAKKIPSWTCWKRNWWLAAEVLTFSRETNGRFYMLAEGSWWWLLLWVNSFILKQDKLNTWNISLLYLKWPSSLLLHPSLSRVHGHFPWVFIEHSGWGWLTDCNPGICVLQGLTLTPKDRDEWWLWS